MTENTLSKPGEFDALEKAEPDELIFPLLGRDPDAPPAIMHWVDLRRNRARAITDEEKLRAELRQCTDAEMIAIEMIARQKGQDAEPAQLPKATYSGIVREKAAGADTLPKLRAQLAESDCSLHDALDLARDLAPLGLIDNYQITIIAEAARLAHNIMLDLSPHRAAFIAEGKLSLKNDDHGYSEDDLDV